MNEPKYYMMATLDHDGSLHIKAGTRGAVEREYNLARTIRGPKKVFISRRECLLMVGINAVMKQSGAREYTLAYLGIEGDLPFDIRRKGSIMNRLVGVNK